LGKPLLEAVGADGGADLDHGRLFPLPVEFTCTVATNELLA